MVLSLVRIRRTSRGHNDTSLDREAVGDVLLDILSRNATAASMD